MVLWPVHVLIFAVIGHSTINIPAIFQVFTVLPVTLYKVKQELTVLYNFECLFLIQTRLITIREANGRLRKARWEERDRMNQIYFPKPGRKHEIPELLKDENLKVL